MEERGLALVDPEAHAETLLPISSQKVIRNPHSKALRAPKANVPAQDLTKPLPGMKRLKLEVSYSFSRYVSTATEQTRSKLNIIPEDRRRSVP
jgi:hypothetical protein